MQLKDIKSVKNLANKRVLLRLDLNVPIHHGLVDKDGTWRLEKSLPVIKYLLSQQAKVIIVAHLGRPEGKVVPELSLLPVAQTLSKMLKKPIEFWADDFSSYEDDSRELAKGSIAMLENIRFQEREQLNCRRLAKRLARLADIYVNDAFSNSHRQDASMHAITRYLPSYAGPLLLDEVKVLSAVLKVKQSLVFIFGGAKISSKVKLIKYASQTADQVLLGGALSNNLLLARGYNLSQSVVDKDSLKIAKSLDSSKIIVPLDVLVAPNVKAKAFKVVAVDKIPSKMMALDIGPKTVKQYTQILAKAKWVVWNGPLGYFENKNFVSGSKKILQALAKSPTKVIVGGGETVELITSLKLRDKFYFVSTGGGAMLTFMQGEKMPALDVLKKK